MTVHRFQDSLKKSQDYADAPWWEPVYREAFPDLEHMQNVRNDGMAQRFGIDRRLTLTNGKQFLVDEKVREKAWPDFALEVLSSREHDTPGWIRKPLECDFIAYAFIPTETCYLLPFPALQRAWARNWEIWTFNADRGLDGFHRIEAKNPGYTTVSCAVPIPVALDAIKDALVISWGAKGNGWEAFA